MGDHCFFPRVFSQTGMSSIVVHCYFIIAHRIVHWIIIYKRMMAVRVCTATGVCQCARYSSECLGKLNIDSGLSREQNKTDI